MNRLRKIGFCFNIAIIFFLASCGFNVNITEDVGKKLQPAPLYKIYQKEPINITAQSNCTIPPSVSIINTETRDGNYLITPAISVCDRCDKVYINPKLLTNYIVDYIKDAFKKSGVKIDDRSSHIILVSMNEAKTKVDGWTLGMDLSLKIDIPENKYTNIYNAHEITVGNPNAYSNLIVNVIHIATWLIIENDYIHNYVLCKQVPK